MNETKSGYLAFAVSIAFHILVFLIVTFTGTFTLSPALDLSPVTEVILYDMDGIHDSINGGGGGGGSPAPLLQDESLQSQPINNIEINDESLFTETSEEKESAIFTNKDVSIKNTQNSSTSDGLPLNVNREKNGTGIGGSGTGWGGGHGSGIGTGIGSGIGEGYGSGMGGGVGNGGIRPKVPPRLLSSQKPVYPENLRQQNVEGSVRLRIIVDINGNVESIEVSKSSGYSEMDTAAINTANSYTFSPAEDSFGTPVRCAISTTVHFKLN